MDRETRDHYALVIQAKDMAGSVGGLSGSTMVNITLTDVNDNPPKFTQSKFPTLLLHDTQFISDGNKGRLIFLLCLCTLCFVVVVQ